MPDAEGHCLSAAARAEFSQDGRYVKFRRVLGDIHARGNFFIAQTRSKHLQDFEFPRRERFSELVRRSRLIRVGGQSAIRVRGMQNQESARRTLERRSKLIRGSIVWQHCTNARPERLRRITPRGDITQDDNAGVGDHPGNDHRLQDRFERAARGLDQNDIRREVRELAPRSLQPGVAAYNFNSTGR